MINTDTMPYQYQIHIFTSVSSAHNTHWLSSQALSIYLSLFSQSWPIFTSSYLCDPTTNCNLASLLSAVGGDTLRRAASLNLMSFTRACEATSLVTLDPAIEATNFKLDLAFPEVEGSASPRASSFVPLAAKKMEEVTSCWGLPKATPAARENLACPYQLPA